ncbi:hypothetical protein ACFLWU_04375 [Chloroflexota bacterium]
MEAKTKMKWLVLLVGGLLLVILILAAGCTRQVPPPQTEDPPPQTTEVVSTCISCHTDKGLLKQTVAPVTAQKSEASSGEG